MTLEAHPLQRVTVIIATKNGVHKGVRKTKTGHYWFPVHFHETTSIVAESQLQVF